MGEYRLFCVSILAVIILLQTSDWAQTNDFLDDKVYATGNNSDGLEIGDINGDGKDELVVGNRGSKDFSIFKRIDGVKDSLAFDYTHKITWAMGVIHIADVNGDGLKDVIIAHYTDYTSATPKDNKIGVCLQNATTHKLDAEITFNFPTGTSARALGFGDLDSDGKPEAVVAHEGGGSSLYVWGWNSSTSKLEIEQTKSGISGQPISITVADVTGDGKNDVVTHGGGVNVYVQNSSGTLDNAKTYSGGGESADVGDINKDGKNDVIGATAYSEGIQIWTQTTLGTLQDAGTRNCGGYTEDCEVADLNRDGLPDVAVASRDRSELWVFYEQSAGGLPQTPAKYIGVQGKWLNELAVGDLNGDGATDVAGSNWGNAGVGAIYKSNVSVWFYDGPTGKLVHQGINLPSTVTFSFDLTNDRICYSLLENTKISLAISDLRGRSQTVITNEYRSAGHYFIPLSDFHGGCGTYIITLRTKDEIRTKKFIMAQ